VKGVLLYWRENEDRREKCGEALAEIEAMVNATPSKLCWTLARELADFTVAFVVFRNGEMSPAGSGTLVTFRGSHYFLTAAHVWAMTLSKSDSIRIPLKENSPCRFAISPKEIAAYGPPFMTPCEWGPDVVLLRIPPERVGSFTAAGRPFYPLGAKRERVLDCALEIWFLMGAPAVRGEFTPDHAIPELQGMQVMFGTGPYSSLGLSRENRAVLDFIDVHIDTTQPDVACDFGGVSGGGLWRVYLYKDNIGEIRSFKILDGVAFWQIQDSDSNLVIRCHGPQAIGSVLLHL